MPRVDAAPHVHPAVIDLDAQTFGLAFGAALAYAVGILLRGLTS
jgi:hypothetical protein